MKTIQEELDYCLNCRNKPCMAKCPLNNDIPGFIQLMKQNDYEAAYKLLTQTTPLGNLCSIVCPTKKQCQSKCTRSFRGDPVGINRLEQELTNKVKGDFVKENNVSGKVAIVGGGPAGLTCAWILAKNGVDVTIYEKYDYLGGLLVHGIPEFRLPKDKVKESIDRILKLGIKVEYNKVLGKDITTEQLKKEYDYVFIGVGANNSTKQHLEGEDLPGVFGANETLEYKTFVDYKGKTVVVSGGGNVAMDISRTVKRMGAEKVVVVYRRSRNEMPAEQLEIDEAMEDGVEFNFQTNILKINGTDKVESIECIKTELVQKEGETRLSPVNIEGSNYIMPIDYIYMAIGSAPDKTVIDDVNVELDWKKLKIDEFGQTSDPQVFAGGDITNTTGTVAWAARSGRNAAYKIMDLLK